MTTFLWTIVILMAVALLAQIFVFAAMALLALRTDRRLINVARELKQKVEDMAGVAKDLRESVQPRVEAISRDGHEIATLVATRSQAIQGAIDDTRRRADRIHLRLMEGVQTVEGQKPGRRGIYREVVEPVHAASQVVRGIKIALWILRKVA